MTDLQFMESLWGLVEKYGKRAEQLAKHPEYPSEPYVSCVWKMVADELKTVLNGESEDKDVPDRAGIHAGECDCETIRGDD